MGRPRGGRNKDTQIIIKICPTCKNKFIKIPEESSTQFTNKIFCSQKCTIPWNKGIKTGIIPKSAFKKGQFAWNKGKKRWWKSYAEFKKGNPKSKNAYKWGRGEENPNWKGGQIQCGEYVYILTKRGYVRRSRFVMEKHLERELKSSEIVHHINEIKNDDRIENLQLFINQSEHSKFHQLSYHFK